MKKFLIFKIFIGIICCLIFFSCSSGSKFNKSSEELNREYIDLLISSKYSEAIKYYDLIMKLSLSKEGLKKVMEYSFDGYGKFIEIKNVKTVMRDEKYTRIISRVQFENGELDFKVTFTNKNRKITGFFISPVLKEPDYANKYKFNDQEITFGSDEWTLSGFLTIPDGTGPFPVLVLIQGSGPLDKDASVGGCKIFRDIAWGLASKSIAVLRFDKWAYTYGKDKAVMSKYKNLTVKEEYLIPLKNAVEYVSLHDKIDISKIFILAHSQGGNLIPRIAGENKNTKGFIMLAANFRPLEDILIYQYEYLFNLDGKIDSSEKKELDKIKKQIAFLKSLDPLSIKEVPSDKLPLGIPVSYWIDLKHYDVCQKAKEINKPVLILQGERDYQVTMDDYNLWKDCLSGKKEVSFKSYPGLNHLFIFGKDKSKPSEYNIPGNLSKDVVEDIAMWINNIK